MIANKKSHEPCKQPRRMSCDQFLITTPRLRPPCVQLLLGGSELMGKRERELSCSHGSVGVCRYALQSWTQISDLEYHTQRLILTQSMNQDHVKIAVEMISISVDKCNTESQNTVMRSAWKHGWLRNLEILHRETGPLENQALK